MYKCRGNLKNNYYLCIAKTERHRDMTIRKRTLRKFEPGLGDFGDLPDKKVADTKEPDTWTIITALDRILSKAQDSRLSAEFWESVKNPLAYLREMLQPNSGSR